MTPPLLSVKLRNQLRKLNPALEVELKNTNINGRKVGCSGYVTDPHTGRVIFVDTESLLQPIVGGAQSQSKAEATRQAVVGTTTRRKIGSRATS